MGVIGTFVGASFLTPTISDSEGIGVGSVTAGVVGVAVGSAAFSARRSCSLLDTTAGAPKPKPAIEPRIPDSKILFQSSDVNLS